MEKKPVKTLYLPDRRKWRRWLENNHQRVKEIWLVYYKKHTGKPSIPYNDAVEEALCFGWIDSTVRKLDEERYIQRYTPRKPNSIWSKLNKQRVSRMIKQGLMTQTGLIRVRDAKKSGAWNRLDVIEDVNRIPPGLAGAIAANPRARKNFALMPPSTKKMFFWWIHGAKTELTRLKRIQRTVQLTSRYKKGQRLIPYM
ncbi:MAG: YdeI/OmpD-associated family protein [Planctomycetes bacterium]|nr:YdeI/OmpD-associated family protein [Planctomycetota bacterium]